MDAAVRALRGGPPLRTRPQSGCNDGPSPLYYLRDGFVCVERWQEHPLQDFPKFRKLVFSFVVATICYFLPLFSPTVTFCATLIFFAKMGPLRGRHLAITDRRAGKYATKTSLQVELEWGTTPAGPRHVEFHARGNLPTSTETKFSNIYFKIVQILQTQRNNLSTGTSETEIIQILGLPAGKSQMHCPWSLFLLAQNLMLWCVALCLLCQRWLEWKTTSLQLNHSAGECTSSVPLSR